MCVQGPAHGWDVSRLSPWGYRSGMRALVTGGAGFIGRHLVRGLLAEGLSVHVLDDLSAGTLRGLDDRATFHRGDVRNRVLVDRVSEDCDVVFHLAASVGPRRVAEDPVGTWSCNVEGTAAVVASCAATGKRLLIASSSEVYGPRSDGLTLREDDPVSIEPHGRRDVYAVSKLSGESLALAEHRSRLLPVTAVRFFNVVGPGQSDRYGMVMARFASAARANRPLTVYGDGSQRRCFLHVSDAVEALIRLARTPASEGQIVNIGNDQEISVLELARRVCDASGGGTIQHVPFEQVYGEGFTDPQRRQPDLSRLRELTGWIATRTLDDIVADVLSTHEAHA